MIGSLEGSVGIYFASFLVAIVSGVVPVVNAELYLIAAVLATGRMYEAVLLALVVAIGQMVGKAVLYRAARGAIDLGEKLSPKRAKQIERARSLVERHGSRPLSLIFVSASAGIPPFYVVSLAAGMLAVRFRSFVLVGLAGRAVRFGVIAIVAVLA
jgi:membrane protein YqaA with SNARE-associated domain